MSNFFKNNCLILTGLIIILGFHFWTPVLGKCSRTKSEADGRHGISKWRRILTPQQFQIESVHFSVRKTRSKSMPYHVDISAFDQNFNLSLQPLDSSIFSPGFRYQGKLVSRKILNGIEKNIFVDPYKMAVLRIKGARNGDYKLEGYVSGFGIHQENCAHLAFRSFEHNEKDWCGTITNNTQWRVNSKVPKMDGVVGNGHHEPSSYKKIRASDAEGEIRLLFDRELGGLITGDNMHVTYAAVTMLSVNLVFKSLSDPEVKLRLLGVDMLTMEQDKRLVQDTNNYIYEMIDALEADKKLIDGPADLVALLTGVVTLSKNDKNEIETTMIGLASRPGACLEKGSVSRDRGAVYSGINTLAHELGHNFGARHDFDVPGCVEKKFVMDYSTGGHPNYFRFSSCSQKDVRSFLKSPKSKCVYERAPIGGVNPSKSFPGEWISLNDQCAAFIRAQGCVPAPIKDTDVLNCLEYKCPTLANEKCEDRSTYEYTEILDGTPCAFKGSGRGICIAGYCEKPKGQRRRRQTHFTHDEI